MHARIGRLVPNFLLLLVLVALLSGCGVWDSVGRPSGTASTAEYTGLDNQSVGVVVYAGQASTDEFPGAREEISAFVTRELQLHVPTARLLNYKEVLNWQDDTLNWFGLTEKEIGKHFSLDRVIFIEVLAYESRSDHNYGDLQGHLRANCKVFEVNTPGTAPAWTGLIDVSWPAGPVPANQGNEIEVRRRTLQGFASSLVGNFYGHKAEDIPLRDR